MSPTLTHPRYQLDRWIATGGMGEVWEATDTLLDRTVAVKVLKRECAHDETVRARFAAEARHTASLQHPHVASVLDVGEMTAGDGESLPFLVMELVVGRPLSAVLTAGRPLDLDAALDVVRQAAEGLQAAHAAGIVHRDVKPGNLLVTPTGTVKVTDFGVARAPDADPITVTGHLVGTPHYLSPEQANGETATPASDVYALGIVLFECLTGRRPFDADTPVAIALKQIREPLPDLPETIPPRVRAVVARATDKDPARRFASAAAFASALRASRDPEPTVVAPTPGRPARGFASPPRRVWVAAGLVLLALIAALALTGLVRSGSGDPTDPPTATAPGTPDTESSRTGATGSSATAPEDADPGQPPRGDADQAPGPDTEPKGKSKGKGKETGKGNGNAQGKAKGHGR